MIDLRSDTVTLPTPEMREAMARAEVGDDVYGEDPTVNRLETLAAELLGKEAGLFLASGTMGNLCAHLAHTQAGQEVICGEFNHSFLSEAANTARVAGLQTRTIPQQLDSPHPASLDPAKVEAAIRADDLHYPKTALICVEQPWSGYVMPLDNLAAIAAVGRRHGIPVHMDGARIFNAALYLGVPASAIAAHVDSVQFCLSKGLAAPVGSMLVGRAPVIERARRARKMIGGGMRQAGIIAAAGLYALQHMVDRLQEDHDNARRLAEGLRRLPGIEVDREEVQTNIFFIDLITDALTPPAFAAALKARGVRISAFYEDRRRIRLVTHYGIERADIDIVLTAVASVLAGATEEVRV